MSKKNKSSIEEIFKSDWKFSAGLGIATYVFAFVFLPFVAADTLAIIVMPMIQLLAKLFIFFCAFVSLFKIVRKLNNEGDHRKFIEFEKIEPTISTHRSNIPFRRRKINSVDEATSAEVNGNKEEGDEPSLVIVKAIETEVNKKWTLKFLNSLDWKVFENLCSRYFSALGVKNSETNLGADGGVDLFLYQSNGPESTAIAQCKKWSNPIKVGALREFYGVMHKNKVVKGYFFTTSKFYQTAIKFAEENNIDLIDGKTLITSLKTFSIDEQERIYLSITEGDYTTPTCVRCGKKMFLRSNKITKKSFWGCNTFRCRGTLNIKQ